MQGHASLSLALDPSAPQLRDCASPVESLLRFHHDTGTRLARDVTIRTAESHRSCTTPSSCPLAARYRTHSTRQARWLALVTDMAYTHAASFGQDRFSHEQDLYPRRSPMSCSVNHDGCSRRHPEDQLSKHCIIESTGMCNRTFK